MAQAVGFKYKNREESLLFVESVIDFDTTNKDFKYILNIGNSTKFSIGTDANASIRINEPSWGEVLIEVQKTTDNYSVIIQSGINYVGHNGNPVRDNMFEFREKEFLNVGNVQFWLFEGKLFTTKDSRLSSFFASEQVLEQNNKLNYPEFIKNVRMQYRQHKEKLEVLQPSAMPQEPQGNIIAKLLPMIVMMVLMVILRMSMNNNKIYALYFVAMSGMGIITSVYAFISSKKKYKQRLANREAKYNEYIVNKEQEIIKKRYDEKLISQKMNTLPQETLEQIENFDARLFEKDKNHDDYLHVPIGVGVVDSLNPIAYKMQEYVETEDPYMDIPYKISEKYKKLVDMPIVLRLGEVNAVGFLGTRNKLYQMIKNIMITIAGQHFFQDTKFYVMLNEVDVPYFEWIRWLQNINEGNRRNIIIDEKSKKSVLEAIYTELSSREGMQEEEVKALPHYIVFGYRSEHMLGHPITNYVKKAKTLGFTFLFFEEYKELIHESCDALVCLDSASFYGFIQETRDAVLTQDFEYPHLSGEQVAKAALKLACVHVNEISLESTLTKNITLYQLLNVMSAYDLNIGKRWMTSNVTESMSAPLGVDSSGQIVCLDLHESAHGPHGLVAGTTGSGKSEILQSYVLSMSIKFHPYEVAFVIIDFKGGGMANQFKDLPHLNGAITNIDGKQIDRSLLSIKAELMKRQRLFAQYNVNKIDDYIELYKAGKVTIPLPHLILIVDEFAELKSEQPEFMKELISAARIGRSLGMHLILATQKPAGVVNDQIWSNSRFKLCLKVQDKNDSNEVLKSPLAAEIREPGRCYLQVGNNEVFQLFQSAYSGASVNVDQMNQQKKYEICKVDFAGTRQVIYQQKPGKIAKTKETQLDAVVKYVQEYCEDNNIKRLPDICLPPLGEVIPYPDIVNSDDNTDVIVPIGIYDEPSAQYQGKLEINLTKNNLFIAGASLYGKTNLIQTIIRGLCELYSAKDICIYIVDFASMMLRNFEGLNQVGGVVTISEDTKLKQLFDMIQAIIEERKSIFSTHGLSSYSAYREAGLRDLKQIVFVIENYGMLKSTYPDYDNLLVSICRDSVSVGVSVIVTNPIAAGISMKMSTYFGEKISLYQNDKTQYAVMFDHCKLYPDDVPGRAIIKRDNTIKEFQIYMPFIAEREIEKVNKIREFVTQINEKNAGIVAKAIPTIPSRVTKKYIMQQYEESKIAPYQAYIGLRYEDIQPQILDFEKSNFIGVLGNKESGRDKYTKYLMDSLIENADSAPVDFYIIDSIDRELEYMKELPNTRVYTTASADVGSIVTSVFEIGKARYKALTNDAKTLRDEPLIVLVFNSLLTEDMFAVGQNISEMHELLINKLKDCKVCIMHTNINNAAVTFKSSPIMKFISEQCEIVAFENAREIKIVNPTATFIRENSKKIENGDAFYIKNGAFTKMRMIINKE